MSAGIVSRWSPDEPCACVSCARFAFFGLTVFNNPDAFLHDRHRKATRNRRLSRAEERSLSEAWQAFEAEMRDAITVDGGDTATWPGESSEPRWARALAAAFAWRELVRNLLDASEPDASCDDLLDDGPSPESPPPRVCELRARTLTAAPGAPNVVGATAA